MCHGCCSGVVAQSHSLSEVSFISHAVLDKSLFWWAMSVMEERPQEHFKLPHQSFYLIDRLGFNAGRSVSERLHENHDETEAVLNKDGLGSETARGGG